MSRQANLPKSMHPRMSRMSTGRVTAISTEAAPASGHEDRGPRRRFDFDHSLACMKPLLTRPGMSSDSPHGLEHAHDLDHTGREDDQEQDREDEEDRGEQDLGA